MDMETIAVGVLEADVMPKITKKNETRNAQALPRAIVVVDRVGEISSI